MTPVMGGIKGQTVFIPSLSQAIDKPLNLERETRLELATSTLARLFANPQSALILLAVHQNASAVETQKPRAYARPRAPRLPFTKNNAKP